MGRCAADNGGMRVNGEMIMGKRICVMTAVLLSAGLVLCMKAQERTPAAIEGMACTFVQTKESSMLRESLVSRGKMYFRAPDKVRWEYVSPASGAFVMDGDQAVFTSDGKARRLDLSKNRMFRLMSGIMMPGLSGSPFVSDGNFTVETEESGDFLEVVMVPVKKDMMKFVDRIRLRLRKSDYVAVTVEMSEPGGDSTRIEFDDIDLQIPADDLFELR